MCLIESLSVNVSIPLKISCRDCNCEICTYEVDSLSSLGMPIFKLIVVYKKQEYLRNTFIKGVAAVSSIPLAAFGQQQYILFPFMLLFN